MNVNKFRVQLFWFVLILGAFAVVIGAGTYAIVGSYSGSRVPAPSKASSPAAVISGLYGSEGRGDFEVIGELRHHCSFTVEDLRVQFAVFDKGGAKVGEAVASISSLAPGTAWKFSARGPVSAPADGYKLEGTYCKYGKMLCEVIAPLSPN